MQFLSPIWFFALAALSIPVAIHLWNIRPGKTLKVGSIALITEASKSSSRSFKLLDILLLIVRCLLLSMLAFLLAAPLLNRTKPAEKLKGWVLIPKENLHETYKTFKPRIDSLSKAGYQFHYFNFGFEKADLAKALADTSLKDSVIDSNYWNISRQLDKKASPGLPVYLFTPNGINHFTGVKPTSPLNLNWQAYTVSDSTRKWIASASLTDDNHIDVVKGNSNASGTSFTHLMVKDDGHPEVDVKVVNGQPTVNLKGDSSSTPVDTTALKIAVYTDKYDLDAGYLKAALQAATNFTGRKTVVRQYGNPRQIPGGQNRLFWLSDQPVDQSFLSATANILKYQAGKVETINSWIDADGALLDPTRKIALLKRISAVTRDKIIWKDGFSNPVLAEEGGQASKTFRLYTHFNPGWGDLVWNDEFPKMILQLIAGDDYKIPAKYDKRILTNRQIAPVKITDVNRQIPVSLLERVDLSKYFWFVIVLLFLAERLLSHKTKTLING